MNFKRVFPLILALLLVLGALTACGGKADGDLAALQASYPKTFGLDTAAGLQIAVRLRPFHNPISSYAHVLDDAYGNEIAALFGGAYAVGPAISLES